MAGRDEIIKRGYVDVKVYMSGLRQSQRLTVYKEKTVHGEVPYLECKNYIPSAELVRLANELQMPIKHKNKMILPKGMTPKDFAKSEILGSAEPATVEAEVE